MSLYLTISAGPTALEARPVLASSDPAIVGAAVREIMARIAPLGPVYQAGTLSGNPVAMTAGLRTLELVSAP